MKQDSTFSAYLYLYLISLFVLFSSSSAAKSQEQVADCVAVTDQTDSVNVLRFMHHYWDASDSVEPPSARDLSLNKASALKGLSLDLSGRNFSPVPEDLGNELVLGEGGSNHWIKFCVSNLADSSQYLVLDLAPAITAEVDFYPLKVGMKSFKTGNAHPMSTRDIHDPSFDFNILLEAGETQEFYIRINARTIAYISASLYSQAAYMVSKDKREAIDGIFIGVFFGLILYTALLYVSVRQSSSLLYIFWCLSVLTLFASVDGRVLQYLLPNSPDLAHLAVVVFYPLCVLLSALFAREFVQLKKYPRLNYVGYAIIATFACALPIAFQFGYGTYFRTSALFAIAVIAHFGLLVPIYGMVFKQSQFCRFLLVAQLSLIICVIDRALFTIGISSQYFIPYTPKAGLVIEVVLMAYFLGLKTHSEKNEAQTHALTQKLKSDQLAQINEMKSNLFANISHEIRTPLTLIQAPLVDILQDTKGKNKEVIQGVVSQSKSLGQLVDQLLTMSKFDSGSLVLRTEKLNVSELVRSMVYQFRSLAKSKELILDFRTNSGKLCAYVDIEKLQIILNNLLSNAIKFTPAGGVIAVQVYGPEDDSGNDWELTTDEYLKIQVSDTGPGIPKEEHDYIFDRYFQSKSSVLTGSGVGTGIGLALVKQLSELHGGRVCVRDRTVCDSQFNDFNVKHISGTAFEVELPLGSAHLGVSEMIDDNSRAQIEVVSESLNAQQQQAQPETLQAIDLSPSNKTILIVDDNDDIRNYIKQLLINEYRVLEARDGVEAEKMVKQSKPELIITDVMMPERDGLEFVGRLKQSREYAGIPIIMLTAKAGLDDRLDGLLAAVDDYITKPFSSRELTIRVSNLLKKYAQFQAFYGSTSSYYLESDFSKNITADSDISAPKTRDQEFISKAYALVDAHIASTNFGVNELAERLHVSRATLARRLARITQFTPSEFIRHCRLEKARQLAAQGQVGSLKELAAAVGFNQAGYFSRLYQKTFNAAPPFKNV